MTQVFSKALMVSEDVQAYVLSEKFYDAEGNAAEIHDGAFVVLGDHDTNDVYGTPDYNVYKATAPKAANDYVAVVDLAEIQMGTYSSGNFKFGTKLTDLKCEAGFAGRVRILKKGDKFWLGEGNFTEAPNGRAFGVLTAGSTLLTPTADMPFGDKFGVKIIATQDAVQGMTVAKNASGAYEQFYLCEVVNVRA